MRSPWTTLGTIAVVLAAGVVATPGLAATDKTNSPPKQTPAAPAATVADSTAATTTTTADPSGATAPDAAARTDKGASAKPDGDTRLKGGQEGTVFRSLTVEGEDRVHIDFERPELEISLDPAKAPGLEWGSARDVLERTTRDPAIPMMALSAAQPMPYLGRPWLDGFTSGAVAHFRPQMEGVERWKLVVADSRGKAVAAFTGKGTPPRDIPWDGRTSDGAPVTPGLTYSYAFEAFDRAGNKRNIVGQGFVVPAYRIDTPNGPVLTFTGDSLTGLMSGAMRGESGRAPDLVLESASWINQTERTETPFRVTGTARTPEQAEALAAAVARGLGPNVIGGAARIQTAAVVEPDAPASGTVSIAPATGPAPPSLQTPAAKKNAKPTTTPKTTPKKK